MLTPDSAYFESRRRNKLLCLNESQSAHDRAHERLYGQLTTKNLTVNNEDFSKNPHSSTHESTHACTKGHSWPQASQMVSLQGCVIKVYASSGAESKGGGGGGKKKAIKGFTKKARRRMMDFQNALDPHRPARMFQAFTFPDEVLEGKTTAGMKDYSNAVLNRFRKRILRRWPWFWNMWRREWEKRKSGSMVGVRCPHFHFVWDVMSSKEDELLPIAGHLAAMWVESMKAEGEVKSKALSVATDDRSYSRIWSKKHADRYVAKYVAKVDEWSEEGQGKHWGSFGVVPIAPDERRMVSGKDAFKLRRLLRRSVRSKRYAKALARRNKRTMKVYFPAEILKFYLDIEECPF